MEKTVSLKTIFRGFPLTYSPASFPDISIGGIAIDSRLVKAGDLFIARKGGSVDGHAYIEKAIEHGAVAIISEREIAGLPVPYIQVSDSIRAVTWLAAGFYDWPGSKLTVIGVTGTDGKTTTCNLIHQILTTAGYKAGLISTVNAIIGDEVIDTGFHVTTPDAQDIQYYLAKMVEAGLTHVVLETTSHGLAQHRVDAAQYDIAVFTNITHEHLDQHGTYENYRAAKGRLIDLLDITAEKTQGNPRLAVFNRDDPSFEYLIGKVKPFESVSHLSYGIDPKADQQARNIRYSEKGIQFDATGRSFQVPVISPLTGEFNVSNILAALGCVVGGLSIDPELAARGIGAMKGIPGRMETINMGQTFTAIVDFAHTPNALRAALETARLTLENPVSKERTKKSRIIAVFGSAGLRDKEKRRLMAETSIRLADFSIFTAEDPRTESLDGILDEMAHGAKSVGGVRGKTFQCIPDRGNAIEFACQTAKPGDIVMICGKGHEQSMCFGETEFSWDDRIAVRASLAKLLRIPGPELQYLPTRNQGHG